VDFQGIGVYQSDGWEQRERLLPALLFIVLMSPPGYPSAWLHPCRAHCRFTPATSLYLASWLEEILDQPAGAGITPA